jgi:hypothetical protein
VRIVEETYLPGNSVSLVARRHGIAGNQLLSSSAQRLMLGPGGAIATTASTSRRCRGSGSWGSTSPEASRPHHRPRRAHDQFRDAVRQAVEVGVVLARQLLTKTFRHGTGRGGRVRYYASIDSSHRAIRTINVRGLPSRPQPSLRAGTGEEVDNGIGIGGPEEATRGTRWPGNWARGGAA